MVPPMPFCYHPFPMQGAVLRYFAALRWSPGRHQLWPPAFREHARTLLLCAHRHEGGAATGLWALPTPVLLHVLEALAGWRTDWLA